MKNKIVVIDDENSVNYALKRIFQEEGYDVETFSSIPDLSDIKDADLLILDIRLKNQSGIDFLKTIKNSDLKTLPVIIITAYATPENFMDATFYGAFEIIKKPFTKDEMLNLVNKVFNSKVNDYKEYKDTVSVNFIANSEKMLDVFKMVGVAASSDVPVLITGETGTGKDVISRIIHEKSHRSKGPFVALNCSAIPFELFESELFGAKKGSFSGSVKDITGKVELADGGTLFLDEIGDLPYRLQSKLLRFLENGTFYKIGETTEKKVNVRVICATNRNLQDMITKNTFREDLFYRISNLTMYLPPLRERKGDIESLMMYFLRLANEEFNTNVYGFTKEAIREAQNYPWRGNIRELKNVVFKRVLETKYGYINSLNLHYTVEKCDLLEESIKQFIYSVHEEELKGIIENLEIKIIKILLEKYENNKTKVANILGISRNTLKTKMKTEYNESKNS